MTVKYHNWLFDEIARRFGDAHIDAIVAWRGGQAIVVPKRPSQSMLQACGTDFAQWLCKERGGETLYLGSRTALIEKRARHARNHRINRSTDSANVIALREGLSERQVKNIRRNAAEHRK